MEIVLPKSSIEVASPPVSTFKLGRAESKVDEPKPTPKLIAKQPSLEKETPKNESPPTTNKTREKELSPPATNIRPDKTREIVQSPPATNIRSDKTHEVAQSPPATNIRPDNTREIVQSPPATKIRPDKTREKVLSPPATNIRPDKTHEKGLSPPATNIRPDKTCEIAQSPPATNIRPDKTTANSVDTNKNETEKKLDEKTAANEESNGVGDKIKKFEKAAEDASASVGRMSRPGSVRGRSRTERLGSDSKEDLPPPATPFKDNVHFDLNNSTEKTPTVIERQQSFKNSNANLVTKWQRSDSSSFEGEKIKPEPQKIIKPEFKPIASPVDVTIRSPSLGAKIPDQFPSHGTAFRNVASPDPARPKPTDNDVKPCKFKNKEKYSVSKGSSYFTRGSEEIWLVKKKDIEEIEERVLDSFRRAGGNVCMRSESMRPASDSGQAAAFTHATMGRTKRQMYARSESLDPQWAGTRAQTLKRQSSVACTCGHDKKTRAKPPADHQRPRSRSHGDDNASTHVLDKYETLV